MLYGSWDKPTRLLSLDELEPYWRNIFEKESEVDDRVPDPIGPVLWDLIDPVTHVEVESTIKAARASAPGLDGMVLSRLKQLPVNELRARLNLWLLAGYCPTTCCLGEMVLILKDHTDIRPPSIAQLLWLV